MVFHSQCCPDIPMPSSSSLELSRQHLHQSRSVLGHHKWIQHHIGYIVDSLTVGYRVELAGGNQAKVGYHGLFWIPDSVSDH